MPNSKTNKRLFMVSLGCPKNLIDSEVMLGTLTQAGYRVVQAVDEAEVILVNTCGFIQSAVEEGIDTILGLAEQKQKNPGVRLVVTGCMVQRYGDGLRKELPEVDLFLGTEDFFDIFQHLQGQERGAGPAAVLLPAPVSIMESRTPRQLSTPSHRGYLKVTEGCDNRCSYCLIPSLRGNLRSRTPRDLAAEARHLEEIGVRELTLVAQDLTAYGLDLGAGGPALPDLLGELLAACSIPWIRLLYLHPARVREDLLRFMADNPRILPYLDIPLQHASSRILKRMNRPYDAGHIENLLAMTRSILPGSALRTTLMVGFPGEAEDDFLAMETLLTRHRFTHVGVFAYSREEGSPAAKLSGQCPAALKKKRQRRLMALQAEIALANNQARVGQVVPVLVEGLSRETDLLLEGRTIWQAPEIDGCIYIAEGTASPGDIVDVTITEAHPYDLVGVIAG